MKDIKQNKSDRPRKLLSIQQCPDCELYDRQIVVLAPDQEYEVLERSKQCPNPECKSKNFAAVVTMSDEQVELPPPPKKQGKYRHMVLEGKSLLDGDGCTCPPFKQEWEFEPLKPGEKGWEPNSHNQTCDSCGKEYYLDWTVDERNYL